MSFDIHPEMLPLIAARAAVPISRDLAVERMNWSAYARANAVPRPAGMAVENRTIAGLDGHPVPIRIYTPAAFAPVGGGPRPGILYYHGGGFVKGDADTSDTNGWGLAEETGAVVVSVDYRLSPEHRYPTPLNDCIAALTHVHANPAAYGVDPTRLAVAGDSAGGTLAAAAALWARANGGPALKCQGLIYPCLSDRMDFDSYTRNAEPPGLTAASMDFYWKAYLGEAMAGKSSDPLATPMIADDLSGLPPAFVLVAEYDPLIDEGVAYAARLMGAGVETGFYRADRMIHGFVRARVDGKDAARGFNALTRFMKVKLDE